MAEIYDPSAVFRDSSRFWVQRVVVPILVCIGTVGNIVSVMVLTRKRMRSSTNAYLTALAVADIIYLFFVLLLSFKHYPNISDRKHELYWKFYGISHWLCDAASSTSVWLTVSFTLERYLVVCHPMKGKVLCTESRAKSIISIVSIFCLLATASTMFEHQLTLTEGCLQLCTDKDYEEKRPLNLPQKVETLNATHPNASINHNQNTSNANEENHNSNNHYKNIHEEISQNCTLLHMLYQKPADKFVLKNNKSVDLFNRLTEGYFNEFLHLSLMNMSCCVKNYTIKTEATALGKNKTYKTFFNWFSSIVFGLLPLVLIATLNCFLVRAVYKSNQNRKRMTNTQDKMSQWQENRITLLLIAVVILFLVCQTPTASFLIYDAIVENDDPHIENIKMGLGNIFNALLALNASCNFIVYSVLSDKYRRTFRALCCNRGLNRAETFSIARSRTVRISSFRNGIKRGKSDYYLPTPRNLEAQSLNSIPRAKSLMQRPLGKAKTSDLNV